jgi:hypothetical protein
MKQPGLMISSPLVQNMMTKSMSITKKSHKAHSWCVLVLCMILGSGYVKYTLHTQLLIPQTYEPGPTTALERNYSRPEVSIARVFQEFSTSNCSSPERYQALQSKHKIMFLTAKFGNADKFKDQVQQRLQEAINTFDWLNEENAIGRYSVPDQWRKEFPNHTQFLDKPEHESATGGGWWFWKPLVILEQLETLGEGDLLFYADNDQTPWWPAIGDFLSFMIDHAEYDWALPRWIYGTEYENTKKDLFVAHCSSTDIGKEQLRKAFHSPQWEAGIHIIRNSARTRQFARQWKALATDYHSISDEPSYLPNHEGFLEGRRDQSLLNMLIKCTFRVGLLSTKISHNCGWLFEDKLIDFNFLILPDVTDNYLITLQNKTASKWAVLQEIKEIDGF